MNNTNQETAINIRTSKEIKRQFNEMVLGGATQTEKFEYLMSIYNESLGRQARLDISDVKKSIEVNMEKITTSLKELEVQANEWQDKIVDCYVTGLGEEFNILKEEIEFDEEAKLRVEDLEKENEKLMDKLSEERDRLAQASDKIKTLEETNKDLVLKVSSLTEEMITVKEKALEDKQELISLNAVHKDKLEQLESANKELTELRKVKYHYEELQKKYNDLLKNDTDTKTTKTTKANKSEGSK